LSAKVEEKFFKNFEAIQAAFTPANSTVLSHIPFLPHVQRILRFAFGQLVRMNEFAYFPNMCFPIYLQNNVLN
jgi:hypothetical protein